MICLALLMIAATYAWMIDTTDTDIDKMDFWAPENVTVTFWGYDENTDDYSIPLENGDLRLSGLKPGHTITVRIKVERFNDGDKSLYIKLLGVEAVGINGEEPYVITRNGVGYDVSNFVTVDIRTVDTDESVTITGEPIPFSEADHDSLFDILNLVEGYEWPASGMEKDVLWLNMNISLLNSIDAGGKPLSLNNYQKQTIKVDALNVETV